MTEPSISAATSTYQYQEYDTNANRYTFMQQI